MRNFLPHIPVFALALVLGGCGFHPLYAENGPNNGKGGGGPGGGVFSTVYVDAIPERVGYEMRNSLLDLFNSDVAVDHASYRLNIILREVREPLAFKGDASITRYNYRLAAHYVLFALPKEDSVKTGNVRGIAAYNVAQSPYATVAGEKDAEDRAAQEIAERIRIELAVFFKDGGKAPTAAEISAAPPEP